MATRWNPLREIASMQNAIDRMFDDTWRATWPTERNGNAFSSSMLLLDAYETDSQYTVVATLPGIDEDQINIQWHEGALTISAEVAPLKMPENSRWLAQERPAGRISRTIILPQRVNIDQAEAHCENGVLTLTLPKSPEAQPKMISIQSANKQLESKNKK